MFRDLPLIVKSALRNRRRSGLTVASIAVSFCLLGVLTAMYRVLFYGGDTTPGQALRLITHHKVSLTQDLPVAYERKIEQVTGVKAVTRLRWFGGTYKDPGDPRNRFGQFAIEPSQLFRVHPEFKIPEEQKVAFQKEKTACVASQPLAAKLGWKLGERITLVNDNIPATLELKLEGIFEDPGQIPGPNMIVYFNWDYLNDSLPASSDFRSMIQQFHLEASSKDEVPRVAEAIDASFENSPYPTETESEQAFQLSFVSFLGNLKLFLAAICGAVTFTVLLVSANTLSMSVRERIREIGVLKTLGFTRSAILGIILGEAGLIALAGGAIGCILAAGLCTLVRQNPGFAFFLKALSLTPAVVALNMTAALLVGCLSALVPALRAARTPITESLRYTG